MSTTSSVMAPRRFSPSSFEVVDHVVGDLTRDVGGDLIAGRIEGGVAVHDDVGHALVPAQDVDHRLPQLGRRDHPQVQHSPHISGLGQWWLCSGEPMPGLVSVSSISLGAPISGTKAGAQSNDASPGSELVVHSPGSARTWGAATNGATAIAAAMPNATTPRRAVNRMVAMFTLPVIFLGLNESAQVA